MRNSLLALSAIVAAASAAVPAKAADFFPSTSGYSAPAFTWRGVYAGVNAGYAFDGRSILTASGPGLAAVGVADGRTDGFAGGLDIGYNYQVGNSMAPFFGSLAGVASGIVVGAEADTDYTNQKDAAYGNGSVYRTRTDYVGTARGRLGYAYDRFMAYGTGGFAFGGVRNSLSVGAASGGSDSIRTGYAYGGGLEYALPPSWSFISWGAGALTVRAEYLHYDLGKQDFAVGRGTARSRVDGNIARAALNYNLNPFGY